MTVQLRGCATGLCSLFLLSKLRLSNTARLSLRGFDVDSAGALEHVARAISPELKNDYPGTCRAMQSPTTFSTPASCRAFTLFHNTAR